jgi:hypothetical protein
VITDCLRQTYTAHKVVLDSLLIMQLQLLEKK